MIGCALKGGLCKTINVVKLNGQLICYQSVFGQPTTTDIALDPADYAEATVYKLVMAWRPCNYVFTFCATNIETATF